MAGWEAMWLWRVNVGWGVRGEWSEGGKEKKKKEKREKEKKADFCLRKRGDESTQGFASM